MAEKIASFLSDLTLDAGKDNAQLLEQLIKEYQETLIFSANERLQGLT